MLEQINAYRVGNPYFIEETVFNTIWGFLSFPVGEARRSGFIVAYNLLFESIEIGDPPVEIAGYSFVDVEWWNELAENWDFITACDDACTHHPFD